MDAKNPNLYFIAGVTLAAIGFLLLDGYAPQLGIVWNAMNMDSKIGPVGIPYRFILIVAVGLITYGAYLRFHGASK